MLFDATSSSAVESGAWWWYIPPGLAIAFLGTSLALINFGIDEFINPRLRVVPGARKARKSAGVDPQPQLGFTPVAPPAEGTRRPAFRRRPWEGERVTVTRDLLAGSSRHRTAPATTCCWRSAG